MIRIAIVGSRNFSGAYAINVILSSLVNKLGADNITIISGGAFGVDTWAENAARAFGVAVEIHKPDWHKDGRYNPGAGYERNGTIIENADRVIAFHDGVSKGTMNSVWQAFDLGKSVVVLDSSCKKIPQEKWLYRELTPVRKPKVGTPDLS